MTRLRDSGPAHKYFTAVPNTVIRGVKGRDLSHYACWLYVYIKSITGEGGTCWQSTANLAHGAKMSTGKVSQAKQELLAAGLLRIKPGNLGKHEADELRISDIWLDNMQEFSANTPSPHEGVHQEEFSRTTHDSSRRLHDMNSTPSPHEGAPSPHEPKKNSYKKNKPKKEENTLCISAKYTACFEQFWHAYPLKKNKQAAYKVWRRKKLTPFVETLIASVQEHQAHDKDWHRGYIPHAATWLNAHGWEDEFGQPDSDNAIWEAFHQRRKAEEHSA